MSATIDWRTGRALPTDRPTTLPGLIAQCVQAHGSTSVLVDGGKRASWQDLDRWSGHLAGQLAEVLPIGERVAILAPNSLAHVVVEAAAWRLGAIAAPVFTGFGEVRLRELLQRLAPRVVVIADPAYARCVPADCETLTIERVWQLAQGATRTADRAVTARTPCLIQFTSGSTGVPRGVVLCHDNLVSQQSAFAMLWPEVGPGDRLASYLPWHHSFGALAERLWALSRGATTTLVPGGGRDRARFVATLRSVKPTVFMSVPKMHAVALGERALDASCLRWAFTAGAPLPEDLALAYERMGVAVYEGWGLTECSPSATITPPGSPRQEGVVGQPIPGVAVGVEAGTGRILVCGPNVMLGYFGCEAPCLDDGVLDSGDLGAWTPAGLRLLGRADHMLKLANGEKVEAPMIEARLLSHPAVHHAVVAADGDLFAIIDPHNGHDAADVAAAVISANTAEPIPYRRIARLYVATHPLTIDNGHLTASMKVARGTLLASWRRWMSDGGDAFAAVAL